MNAWQQAALEWGQKAAVGAVDASTKFVKNKVKERIDRGRRFKQGIHPFELVEVRDNGVDQQYTFLPIDYLFWMGVTLESARIGNVVYSPQKFGGYYPNESSPAHQQELREFSDRINLMCGEDFIPLFRNGRMHLIYRDSAVTCEAIDNLRIAHESNDQSVIDLPVCCISRVVSIGRLKGDEVYRVTLWNGDEWSVGLRSFAPFQSLDEQSDDRLVQLFQQYAKHGARRR